MSKLNTRPRQFYINQRMTTVIDPNWNSHNARQRPLRLSDYHDVPLLDTHGTWRMLQCMSTHDVGKLAAFANMVEKAAQQRRTAYHRPAHRG